MYNAKIKNYQKSAVKMTIAGADRYEIIQLLMAGALEKMVHAKIAIKHKNYEAKSDYISKASAIILSLRESIDFSHGGKETLDNLSALYTYMIERLVDANVENDPELVDEVSNLLKEIKAGWDAIPAEIREQTLNSEPSLAVNE